MWCTSSSLACGLRLGSVDVVLAMVVSDPDLIAIIALAVSVMLGIPAWSSFLQRKRTSQKLDQVSDWVRPNGAGSLAEMSERLLEQLGLVQHRLGMVESELSGVRGTVATSMSASDAHADDDDRRFRALDARMDRMGEILDGVVDELHRIGEQVAGCGQRS